MAESARLNRRPDTDRPNTDGKMSNEAPRSTAEALWANVVSPAGYILAVSYPVLALSTGARALYQLFVRDDITDYFPVLLSALAALCYLVATIGFAYRRRWTWWLSVIVLGFETTMTLVIGTWSLVDPPAVGRTVWRHFGEDYGYFPLFQPLLGLIWLLWPQTIRAYGALRSERSQQPRQDENGALRPLRDSASRPLRDREAAGP